MPDCGSLVPRLVKGWLAGARVTRLARLPLNMASTSSVPLTSCYWWQPGGNLGFVAVTAPDIPLVVLDTSGKPPLKTLPIIYLPRDDRAYGRLKCLLNRRV